MEETKPTIPTPKEPKKGRVFFSKMVSVTLGILGLLLVISIIGIGALLAGHVWNPNWNPFKQTSSSNNIIKEKTKAFIGK